MTQDSVKTGHNKEKKGAAASVHDLTPQQIASYLRSHPDFFARHASLLEDIDPPKRPDLKSAGSRVIDLQQATIRRLRQQKDLLKGRYDELIESTRSNHNTQTRLHEAVLVLLSAKSFEQLVDSITLDLTVLLDLDLITLCVEQIPDGPLLAPIRSGVFVLPSGGIDQLLGKGRFHSLMGSTQGDPGIYGAGASLVASQALFRLTISDETPPAMIAFGSRDPAYFDMQQGTDLLGFLVRVIERMIYLWLFLET